MGRLYLIRRERSDWSECGDVVLLRPIPLRPGNQPSMYWNLGDGRIEYYIGRMFAAPEISENSRNFQKVSTGILPKICEKFRENSKKMVQNWPIMAQTQVTQAKRRENAGKEGQTQAKRMSEAGHKQAKRRSKAGPARIKFPPNGLIRPEFFSEISQKMGQNWSIMAQTQVKRR